MTGLLALPSAWAPYHPSPQLLSYVNAHRPSTWRPQRGTQGPGAGNSLGGHRRAVP